MISLKNHTFLSWRWIIVAWTIIAAVSATMLYISLSAQGGGPSFIPIFLVKLIVWLFWGAVTPLIISLGKRFNLDKGNRLKSIALHLPLSIFFASMNILLYSAIVYFSSDNPASLAGLFFGLLLTQFEWYFIIYWAIIIVGYTFEFYGRFKAGELEAIQLEAELMKSQLQALKMQLHPHFLFNTLNNISALVRKGEQKNAVSMLSGVSELLRITLSQKDEQEVSLETEMNFIKRYLEIEEIRFKNKFDIRYNLEEEAMRAIVPSFILQPIVENAVNHGLSKKLNAKSIRLSAVVKDGYLNLEIYNDGPALDDAFNLSDCTGIGLTTTLNRLQQAYKSDFEMNIQNYEEGVIVHVTFPYQTASS